MLPFTLYLFNFPGLFLMRFDVRGLLPYQQASIKKISIIVAVGKSTCVSLARAIGDGLCTITDFLPSVEMVTVTAVGGGQWSRVHGELDSNAAEACKADLRAWFEGDGAVWIIWNETQDSSH